MSLPSKRWSATVYLSACFVVSLPGVLICWLLAGRPNGQVLTPLVAGWGLAWLNAVLAAIVNRHVFQKHPNAFLAWALLGNGFRLLLLTVATLQVAALLPPPPEPLFWNFLAGYLLFLFIEIFLLYNFSRKANHAPAELAAGDIAQAE
jgi:hypothetical protein